MTELWMTLGPASLDSLDELVARGVGGVRLTFSFGTPQLQLERARLVRDAAARAGRPCRVIADLPGEKVRLGTFTGESTLTVAENQSFTLVPEASVDPHGTGLLPVPHERFVDQLRPADRIIVGDGAVALSVVEAGPDGQVRVRAESAGMINHTRGLTVQGNGFSPACLTEEDLRNLHFIADHEEFDAVAVSFAERVADLEATRKILSDAGRPDTTVVAKIETAAGVRNIDEICGGADLVMAARGDLALNLPWVELPAAVDAIADSAARTSTPWVLATQLAEGIERFTFPTRAEICDLAHWVGRGCAAVMLSYETVFGRDAVLAVRSVDAILRRWTPRPASG